MQQRLVKLVSESESGLSSAVLIERLYANKDGPSTTNIISVMAKQINKKLAPFNIAIQAGRRGSSSVYRLVELE